MRAKHTKHDLPAFPVYSSAFLSDTELVIGGGGGQAKTGEMSLQVVVVVVVVVVMAMVSNGNGGCTVQWFRRNDERT